VIRLKELRENAQQSLADVAEACGITRQNVHAWETGKIVTIPYRHLMSLSAHFGVSVDYLLGNDFKKRKTA